MQHILLDGCYLLFEEHLVIHLAHITSQCNLLLSKLN